MSFQKRAPRYSVNDWFDRSYSNWKKAETTRIEGRTVLEESKRLRNESDNKSKWDQQDSNTRLSEQVERVRAMKVTVEKCIKSLEDELDKMAISKDVTEKLQTFFYQIMQMNTENLAWREGRREIDLVVDEVEDELHKERLILDRVKDKLQSKISELFEQLAVTKQARHSLLCFLQRKIASIDIDIDQYDLTELSPSITLKPDANRVPEKMFSVQEWEEAYCGMKELCTNTFKRSTTLRETIHHIIDTISNDVYSQNIIVMFALRKHIHELETILSEDRFQRELLEEEAKRLEEEIRCLDVSIKHKVGALKVAQTRLENRLYKTHEDLLRDASQCGLSEEMKQLELTILTLKEKKCQAQRSLASLEKEVQRLRNDLDHKGLALRIDQQCLHSRTKLSPDCNKMGRELEETIVKCVRPDAV